MIDIKAIKAAAEAATPQPWIEPGEGNMPFICMLTPATVIALCDEIEKLRKDAADWKRRYEIERGAVEQTIVGGRYPDGSAAW